MMTGPRVYSISMCSNCHGRSPHNGPLGSSPRLLDPNRCPYDPDLPRISPAWEFRREGSNLLRAEILERSWLALILSFIIFVFYAVPQAFAIPLPHAAMESLIGVHLALIAYAFYLFYVVVRPEKSQLAIAEG